MVTKCSGVERDLDLIAPMAQAGLAAVYVTITTLDAELARMLEPRAAAPTGGCAPSARWPMPACRSASAWRRKFRS